MGEECGFYDDNGVMKAASSARQSAAINFPPYMEEQVVPLDHDQKNSPSAMSSRSRRTSAACLSSTNCSGLAKIGQRR
jgi:hypothetical protein